MYSVQLEKHIPVRPFVVPMLQVNVVHDSTAAATIANLLTEIGMRHCPLNFIYSAVYSINYSIIYSIKQS